MTTMTKPTTMRRHFWSLRRLAEICEQHGLPCPKVEIGYSGGAMEAQWYRNQEGFDRTDPTESFEKVIAAFPDLTWERNVEDAEEHSYDSNYFRIRAKWEPEGGLPVDLEVWATRPGFPIGDLRRLPVRVGD